MIVLSGFVTACLAAASPVSRSPFFVNATILGVVVAPVALGMITGVSFSTTETTTVGSSEIDSDHSAHFHLLLNLLIIPDFVRQNPTI